MGSRVPDRKEDLLTDQKGVFKAGSVYRFPVHGKTIDGTGFKYSFLIRKKVFFPVRNARTHPQDTA